jgi:hypothetical protein
VAGADRQAAVGHTITMPTANGRSGFSLWRGYNGPRAAICACGSVIRPCKSIV